MTTKPALYPDWTVNTDGTDNDVPDGTTGENNVVEPAAGKKLIGWSHNEKPPRQYFNWLARLTTQWIRYLNNSFPPNLVSGFELSKSSQAIVFSKGYAAMSSGEDIAVSAAMTKKVINAGLTAREAWALGTGNGGVASAVSLSTGLWLHAFVIMRIPSGSTAAVYDFGFDTSVTAANLKTDTGWASAFTYRRLGSIQIKGSSGSFAIQDFLQEGDRFYLLPAQQDVNEASGPVGTIAFPLSIPPDVSVRASIICAAEDIPNSAAWPRRIWGNTGNTKAALSASPLLITEGTPFEDLQTVDGEVRIDVAFGAQKTSVWTVGWRELGRV